MLRNYLIIAISLGAGILVGYTLLLDHSQEETDLNRGDALLSPVLNHTSAQTVEAESLAALRHQLEQERQAHEQLKTRLDTLQKRVEELEHVRSTEVAMTTTATSQQSNTETTPVGQTSVQALIEAGISEEQAVWIQERLDEIELQQLYLRDRATREGWLNKPRYHRERQQYQKAVADLRNEVDDDVYDRLLYALGRANRVVVRDTIQNSTAAQYGLQSGDRIIEYDGQRIFSGNELSSLVTQGSAGVMTLIRVEREGAIQDIYVPRGPLGVRMSATRLAP